MMGIAKFEKVSFTEFQKASDDLNVARLSYEHIQLPRRATKGSAGYDFFSPVSFTLKPNETIKIATGIRVKMEAGWVLMLFPRSSLGFKYRMQLNNTVGIIDSDYYDSDNEGHIFIKVTNDTNESKELFIDKNMAFAQGIFIQYGLCIDDQTADIRNGGFGSTDN